METEAKTPATNSEYQLTASTSLCYQNWFPGQLKGLAQVVKLITHQIQKCHIPQNFMELKEIIYEIHTTFSVVFIVSL